MIIRPIEIKDLETLITFAFTAHLGITSLPRNEETLQERLELSVASFQKKVETPGKEIYLFVLEDNGQVIGTSGIEARSGQICPLCLYSIEDEMITVLSHKTSIKWLKPVHYFPGPTEIGALYLSKDHRKSGLGKLLSLSRFLFMRAFPERFTDTVFALMRGYILPGEVSWFWEHVGRKFYDVDFKTFMEFHDQDCHFIPTILPKYPLNAAFFSPDAVQAMGRVHPHTEPAVRLLKREGFDFTAEIDAFDGGPKMEAKKEGIRTFKDSQLLSLYAVETSLPQQTEMLIANNRLDFRACLGQVEKLSDKKIILQKSHADLLQVKVGDTVRVIDV